MNGASKGQRPVWMEIRDPGWGEALTHEGGLRPKHGGISCLSVVYSTRQQILTEYLVCAKHYFSHGDNKINNAPNARDSGLSPKTNKKSLKAFK